MPQKMSQAEFIKRLKEEMPELKDYSDFDIIRGISQRRPDILEKVEGPNETRARADVANAKGQAAAEHASSPFTVGPYVAGLKGTAGYLHGALLDLPKSFAMAIPNAIESMKDIANPPHAISKTMGLIDSISHMRDTAMKAGSEPYAFGRMMGQITGQPLAGEALLGGFPKGTFGLEDRIPSGVEVAKPAIRATTRVISKPIRALSGPTRRLGEAAMTGAPFAPWGWKAATATGGYGLKKIGEGMKDFGIPLEEKNATAIQDFWGSGGRPGVSSSNSGKPKVTTPEQDLVDKMLMDAMSPSKATSTSINEGGRQFRDKLPADTDLGFRPATSEQPQLPFGESPSGEWMGPSKQEVPTPGRQSERFSLEGGEGRQPIGQIPSRYNEVPIESPNPLKDRILRDQGFEPSGPPDENGTQIYRRKDSPVQPIPNAKNDGSVKVEPIPNARGPEEMSTDGLNTKDIVKLYGEGWKPKKGDPTTLVRAEVKGQVGGNEPPSTAGDTGIPPGMGPSEDWKQTYMNLRKMLGRDPSAAEIDAAQARSVKPGESTGNVAPFQPTRDKFQQIANEQNTTMQGVPPEKGVPITHNPELGGFQSHRRGNEEWVTHPSWTEPHGPFKLDSNEAVDHILEYQDSPEFEAYVNSKDRGARPSEQYGSRPEDAHSSPYGPDHGIEGDTDPNSPVVSFPNSGLKLSDPNHPLNQPQNDVLGVRTRNTLGPRPVSTSDTPVQPRMGQQDLPLGPQGGRPSVDEYGIPQNRDWSPEDIFRINHEMKNMSPVPSKPQIPEPQQMNIPEIGDDAIQRYLQQEDATPPEMVDLPKHSPDKISFMQKLKDMLDQEEYA